MIGEPPVLAGAVQPMVASPSAGTAVPMVGAPGAVRLASATVSEMVPVSDNDPSDAVNVNESGPE